MADKLNIIVGAAQFWIGTSTASKPAYESAKSYNETLGSAADWRNVGYTTDGVEVSYSPEFTGVEVDQLLDDAKLFKTRQNVSINTTFAEATLENLLVVWGQANDSLTSSGASDKELAIIGGDLGQAPAERQVIAVGNGPEKSGAGYYNERVYHASRAISVEESSHAMRRNEATTLPVSFRLLPTDAAKNPYGSIHDRVRNW